MWKFFSIRMQKLTLENTFLWTVDKKKSSKPTLLSTAYIYSALVCCWQGSPGLHHSLFHKYFYKTVETKFVVTWVQGTKKKFDKTNTVARAQHTFTERRCRCAAGRGAPSFTWNSSLSVLQLVLEPLTVSYVTFTKLLNICLKSALCFFPDTFITNFVQFILTTVVLVR